MTRTITRHEISLCGRGFAQLLSGRALLGLEGPRPAIWRRADRARVRPRKERCATGAVAIFQVRWVSRAQDDNGQLSYLLAPHSVVLGLTPANILVATRELAIVAPETPPAQSQQTTWTPSPPGRRGLGRISPLSRKPKWLTHPRRLPRMVLPWVVRSPHYSGHRSTLIMREAPVNGTNGTAPRASPPHPTTRLGPPRR